MTHSAPPALGPTTDLVIPAGEPIDWSGPWVPQHRKAPWVDIRTFDRFQPPTEQFFVRSHGGLVAPKDVAEADWRLRLEGSFAQPATLTLDDLRRYPRVTRAAAIECSGNSFTFLATFSEMPWLIKLRKAADPMYWHFALKMMLRRGWCALIGNAVFTGVRLLDVLEDHPLASDARELVFLGGDRGVPNEVTRGWSWRPTETRYGRAFTIDDVRRYDPILCFEMNGAPLTPDHGFPLRMVVPGVFGSEWTKWLDTIEASPDHFDGFYQKHYYNNQVREIRAGREIRRMAPVHQLVPKSTVVRVIRRAGVVEVYGIAWGGFAPLAKVDVSLDRGRTWAEAELLGGEPLHSWVLWRFGLPQARSGQRVTLLPRAWATDGACQPAKTPWYQHYAVNSILPAWFRVP